MKQPQGRLRLEMLKRLSNNNYYGPKSDTEINILSVQVEMITLPSNEAPFARVDRLTFLYGWNSFLVTFIGVYAEAVYCLREFSLGCYSVVKTFILRLTTSICLSSTCTNKRGGAFSFLHSGNGSNLVSQLTVAMEKCICDVIICTHFITVNLIYYQNRSYDNLPMIPKTRLTRYSQLKSSEHVCIVGNKEEHTHAAMRKNAEATRAFIEHRIQNEFI